MGAIVEFKKNTGQFKHSNKLIQAKYKLTLTQQRIIMSLISMISPTDEILKRYKIDIKKFAEMYKMEGGSAISQVKEATKDLLSRPLIISEEKGVLQVGWISSAKYNNGEASVTIAVDPNLTPYLIDLKEQYTIFVMDFFTKFNSYYSHRIYMLLKQYDDFRTHRSIKLSELRLMLGVDKEDGEKDVEKKKYKLYSDFRARVLDRAVFEINEYTDLKITLLKEDKIGKKVDVINFLIEKNPKYSPNLIDVTPPAAGEDETPKKSYLPKTPSESGSKKLQKKEKKDFTPPTLEEVTEYCQKERRNLINPRQFFDYYHPDWLKANGKPVLDWKKTVKTWEGDDKGPQPESTSIPSQSPAPTPASVLAPESEEIKEIRSQIKFMINNQAQKPQAANMIASSPIKNQNGVFVVTVADKRLLEFQQFLTPINVKIEVKT